MHTLKIVIFLINSKIYVDHIEKIALNLQQLYGIISLIIIHGMIISLYDVLDTNYFLPLHGVLTTYHGVSDSVSTRK